MSDMKISEMFENGTIFSALENIKTESLIWNEHNIFKGVALKHLIKGSETGGNISCHLVRVNPGCILDTHVHNGKIEIHNVLEGSGKCMIGEKNVVYNPGIISLIPADTNHKVTAGNDGLFILAVFSPALL